MGEGHFSRRRNRLCTMSVSKISQEHWTDFTKPSGNSTSPQPFLSQWLGTRWWTFIIFIFSLLTRVLFCPPVVLVQFCGAVYLNCTSTHSGGLMTYSIDNPQLLETKNNCDYFWDNSSVSLDSSLWLLFLIIINQHTFLYFQCGKLKFANGIIFILIHSG